MKVIAFLLLLTLLCCSKAERETAVAAKTINTTAFVPYTEDKMHSGFERDISDTITGDGWKIEYLVKNDSTKHKDIYIQWSKGNIKRMYCGYHLLELEGHFTPRYKTETPNYIFMPYELRGDDGLLILPKNSTRPELNFAYLVGYSVEYRQIAYIPESSYSLDNLDIEVYDLKSGTTKSVRFSKPCNISPESGCITKVEFSSKEIKISGGADNSRKATEVKIIRF